MTPFETDQGTLQLIGHLTAAGRERLRIYLDRCDELASTRRWHQVESVKFEARDFAGRDDVKEMKLERSPGADRKILATVKLTNGALWRRGQLRIPGLILPETVRLAVKGELLERIVENPPFTGFTITGTVQDSGTPVKLRIRCTAEHVGPIVLPEAGK